ncbi:DsbA family protein [Pseudocolwellia agarivorans]|uniref:DsbA family protein n=1 Tax=Pseudocolwellia agarivorans TaxID=1911682 RepID=UPI0009851396|nr:DsbA family protein [Pseudocolwellia agarivorans]
MNKAKLHIVVDPLCGWTYGAGPLIEAANNIEDLTVKIHSGGMLTGNNRKKIHVDWREFALKNDKVIAERTGQVFGEQYTDGLLTDHSVVLDSSPASTAILAAEQLGFAAATMLNSIQKAYYQNGKNITQLQELVDIAVSNGLSRESFTQKFEQLKGEATSKYFDDSRILLQNINGRGFPSSAIEFDNNQWQELDIASYYGQTEAWQTQLASLLKH